MKRLVSVLVLGLLLSGCARHYVITLNSGGQIATANKPRLKGERWYFKDATGAERSVSAGSVSEVSPASMSQGGQTMKYSPTGK